MGFISIHPDNSSPTTPVPTPAEEMHQAVTTNLIYRGIDPGCIDAHNIVKLNPATPFDWSMCGYYAVFHDFHVSAQIFFGVVLDGQVHISEPISECHEVANEHTDASLRVLNALDVTNHPAALRWRNQVADRLRDNGTRVFLKDQAILTGRTIA